MRTFLLASCAVLGAVLSWGQTASGVLAPDIVPEAMPLKRLIRERIDADGERWAKRPGAHELPPYAGLPETVSAALPEDDGFVLSPRVPGESLVADVDGLEQAGVKLQDAVDDEEWARLPDQAVIHRALARAPDGTLYTAWRYPRGTRLIHRIFLKPSHRLVELRLEQKMEDDADDHTGAWAFGIYRPADDGGSASLYRPRADQAPETVELPMPDGFGRFRWTRLGYDSCRACHISMGPGWYQYSDEAHAGPCGFVPFNRSLLADWGRRYERRYGYFPFRDDDGFSMNVATRTSR
ncbi:MAG TPA: hypothetical protein VN915_11555 [Elusimicrobiota bacterium]|nr:hypothetical protein [Elusimicrobiota bacterium]